MAPIVCRIEPAGLGLTLRGRGRNADPSTGRVTCRNLQEERPHRFHPLRSWSYARSGPSLSGTLESKPVIHLSSGVAERMRIFLVEDTHDVGEAIVEHFARIGHAVDWATDGEAAAAILDGTSYDLIILDVMLPGRSGFSILQHLRSAGSTTPVLMLTARSEVEDRVSALDIGADDYLVKPFDFRELEARARALLRRRHGEATNLLECGDICIDRSARAVRVGQREVHLTRREVTLLEILASRPGRVFSKEDLLDQVFGFDEEAPSFNAVELYIGRLRKKLHGARAEIVTVRGFGYQMVPHGSS